MRLLAICAAGFVLAVHALAGPPQENESRAAFEAELAEVQVLLRARKWDRARSLLVDALESAGEEDFVLLHASEIEEDLARCAFWQDYEIPSAKEVVGGDLLSWNERSGAIKLRYREGDRGLGASEDEPGDFFGTEGVFLHPLTFKGPYTIELESDGIAGRNRQPPTVLVNWGWGSLQGLAYGRAYGVAFGDLVVIFELVDGALNVLDTTSTSAVPSNPFKLKIQVGATSITASVNRKSTVKVKRPKGAYGQFGFLGLENLEQVLISGKVEPSWIAGLVDDAVQRDWQAFREGFDAFASLDPWLASRIDGDSATARELIEVLPDGAPEGDGAAWKRVEKHLEEGEVTKALKYLRALGDEVSAPSRDWLLAQFLLYDGEIEESLEHCRLVSEAVPQFYEGRLLQAQLERAATSSDEAAPLFHELTQDFPFHIEAYEALATLSIFDGRPEEAFAVIGDAIANGVDPRALGHIERTIYRSDHGPQWGNLYTYQSKHYIVSSDLSDDVCYDIAQELEKFYKKYINRVRRPSVRAEAKFEVYFFSGFAGYSDYTDDLLGDPAEGTLGLYSPWLKQLVIWNSPRNAMVMRTVRHEGFHQYLDIITSEAPVWFNEGMAEYFEQARIVRGTWKDDQVNEEHVAVLQGTRGDWTPLREFVHGDTRAFRSKQGLHYPQAWALCHFLYNTTRERRKMAETLLDALVAGRTRKEAVGEAFGSVDWRSLQREFEAYVDELK